MRGYIHSVHPAGAAIAAVLALSSTYSFAQEVPPASDPAADTVIVPPPVASPALTPSQSPTQPMVQPTASVEDRLNAAVAASETEAANRTERAAAPAEGSAKTRKMAAPVRAASRTEPVRAVPAQPAERAEARPVAAPASDPAPVNLANDVAPVAAVTPAQADEARATDGGTNQSLLWALGGGALLLAGLGGAAAVRRRRPVLAEVERDELAVPVTAPVAPVERAPVSEPAASRAFVATPVAAGAAHGSSLEAMVAAPPSAENPFRTHRKRMARARFLLAQQEKQGQGSQVAEREPVPPQTIHAEPQMQTVYRMGSNRNQRMTFKPQTR